MRLNGEKKSRIDGSGVVLGGERSRSAGKTVPADHGFPATRKIDRFCAVPRGHPGNVGYELFRGAMTPEQLGWSERQLRDYVRQSKPGNPYLQAAMDLLPP